MRWFSILMLFIAVSGSLFLIGIKFSAAQAICLDPKAHLIWPSPQSANIIPMRSANSADTLTNSPVSVNGSNVGVSGNLSATGNVSGANICVGASCVSNWSQVSGPWTQIANNLYPTNTSTNVGIGTNAPQYKLDVNGTFRVMVNGEERFAIKENPPTASSRNPRLAQVNSAQAQSVPTKVIDLFGGSAYFLKRGQNSDIALQVGDRDTGIGAVKVKGSQQPNFSIYDQNEKLRGVVQYYNNAVKLQHWGGYSPATPNVPYTEVEVTDNASIPVVKIIGGRTFQERKVILEISEE